MTVTALDRANFFSQAINSAAAFHLGTASDVRTFLEGEARIFAAERGYQAADVIDLARGIPARWLEHPEEIQDRFRGEALESLAQHFGHSTFKAMVKAVWRGVSTALDDEKWIKTEGMGQSLLDLCYSHSDFAIYERLHLGLGPAGAPTDPATDAIAERIRAEASLTIAVRGGEGKDLEVILPDRGGQIRRSITMKPGSPDEAILWYSTGNAFAQSVHSVHYQKSGERWVPSSGTQGPSLPGTFEHRVFEALAARAR